MATTMVEEVKLSRAERRELRRNTRTPEEIATHESRMQLLKTLAGIAGLVLLGGIGIGALGGAFWLGWYVAGVIAVKLGLIGFWWHLLGWIVVGLPFITTPILGLLGTVFGAISSAFSG